MEDIIDDLQGRIRRKTLIFKGIPEKLEGNDNWVNCELMIQRLIQENFALSGIEIERAHRSPARMLSQAKYPRSVYVAFLRWKDKDKLMNEIMKKGSPNLTYNGEPVRVFVEELFSPKVMALRAQLRGVRNRLKKEKPDRKVFFKYPAKIFIKEGTKITQYHPSKDEIDSHKGV